MIFERYKTFLPVDYDKFYWVFQKKYTKLIKHNFKVIISINNIRVGLVYIESHFMNSLLTNLICSKFLSCPKFVA